MFAATYPQRVRTLTLVSAPDSVNQKTHESYAAGFASREEALRTMGARKWAAAIRAFCPGMQEWYVNEMGRTDVEVLCGLYGLLQCNCARLSFAN